MFEVISKCALWCIKALATDYVLINICISPVYKLRYYCVNTEKGVDTWRNTEEKTFTWTFTERIWVQL